MRLVFKTLFGSHLYGTDTPASDKDFKGIAIPTAEDIINQKAFRTINISTKPSGQIKNTSEDVDTEIFSLHQFIKLCDEGQTMALDILFSTPDKWVETSPLWMKIIDNRYRLIHRKATAFVGYCQHQAAKYGIKGSRVHTANEAFRFLSRHVDKKAENGGPLRLVHHWNDVVNELGGRLEHTALIMTQGMTGDMHLKDVPSVEICGKKIQQGATFKQAAEIVQRIIEKYGERAKQAETNKGIDWKAVSHAFRVCYEAQELLQTGNITFPLPQAEYVKTIKNGLLPYVEVAKVLEVEIEKVKKLEKESKLPESIDTQYWNDFIMYTYTSEVLDYWKKNGMSIHEAIYGGSKL